MQTWQYVFLAFLVLLPLALLSDFHPHRERLTSRGRPIEREWLHQSRHGAPSDEAHH